MHLTTSNSSEALSKDEIESKAKWNIIPILDENAMRQSFYVLSYIYLYPYGICIYPCLSLFIVHFRTWNDTK